MANIPVERKDGTPWWLWLLGLLLLGGLIWLGAELFDNEPDADEIAGTEDNVGMIDDAELDDDLTGLAGGGVEDEISSLAALATGTANVGREVNLRGVRVINVVGDSSFFITESGDDRVLVVLEDLGEEERGAEGSDGRYNVDEGETLDVRGTVERFDRGIRGASAVQGADMDRVMQQGFYIKATTLGGEVGLD